MTKKLYAVVAPWLSGPQRAVQAAHALIELAMCEGHGLTSKKGWGGSLVMLASRDKEEFIAVKKGVEALGLANALFREPHYQNRETAVAFLASAEEAEKLVYGMPLA